MQIHNCHIHTFTLKNIPVDFLPLNLIRFMGKRPFTRDLVRVLQKLNPFSETDRFDRFAAFVQIGALESQLAMFENIKRFYPEDTRFVVLAMDMEYMGCGYVRQSFQEQLDELAALKRKYGDLVLPFIAVDPRRNNILDMVKVYIEDHGFHGIKLYPPLGYFPYDARLAPVWKYAEANRIPVVAHTSCGGVYFRGKITKEMLPDEAITLEGKSNKELCNIFAHPKNYDRLLDDFPDLRISLAHFGGQDEWGRYLNDPPLDDADGNWLKVIMDLARKRPSLYTDIAYTLFDRSYTNYLKVLLRDEKLKTKILFGSDYYLVEQDSSEKNFSIDLRASLGEQDYQQIAEMNPKSFLYKE